MCTYGLCHFLMHLDLDTCIHVSTHDDLWYFDCTFRCHKPFYTFARRGARRRYMTSWHFIYNFICSFHTSLYVKCHILTRWWRHMTICGSGIWSVIWSVAHESKQGWEGGCDRAGEHEGSSFAATDREGFSPSRNKKCFSRWNFWKLWKLWTKRIKDEKE